MNAPFTIYGYQIIVPEDDSLDFIHDIISINDTLIEPIQIYCITPSPFMNEVQVILGFIPDDVSRIMFHLDALREFIMDNPMFDGIHLSEKPAFYAGFTWKDDTKSEADSETDSEADSKTDSETDSDAESETESQDNDSSDSDDDTIHDEINDKSISYYVSKYYI
jgi:hypothetical protein